MLLNIQLGLKWLLDAIYNIHNCANIAQTSQSPTGYLLSFANVWSHLISIVCKPFPSHFSQYFFFLASAVIASQTPEPFPPFSAFQSGASGWMRLIGCDWDLCILSWLPSITQALNQAPRIRLGFPFITQHIKEPTNNSMFSIHVNECEGFPCPGSHACVWAE